MHCRSDLLIYMTGH